MASYTEQAVSLPWWAEACDHLSKSDPQMAALIEVYGNGELNSVREPFGTLIRSIVGQQISTKAALSIWQRLIAACPEMTPVKLSKKHRRTLRACGLSDRKIDYVLDVCRFFLQEKLTIADFDHMSDEEIIEKLTSIKGVGKWTAEMFLIFTLGRQNVFPLVDLGIIKAVQKIYFSSSEFEQMTASRKEQEILRLSEKWHPYKTAASWFLWKSLNNSPMRY